MHTLSSEHFVQYDAQTLAAFVSPREGEVKAGEKVHTLKKGENTGALPAYRDKGVRYVLIGALAATLHGSPLRTADADITPAPDRENLERLAAALRALDARVFAADTPRGLAFDCSPETLERAETWNLVTRHGRLDISFTPSGTRGYPDLVRGAVTFRLGDIDVPVASLLDVIRSKEAAGRDKDRFQLPTLRKLLGRLDAS
jgi:hypothetical protein